MQAISSEQDTPKMTFSVSISQQNPGENEDLGKDERVEDGEEEVDRKKIEEDGWLHCYQGGSISETKKHLLKVFSEKTEILFNICPSEKRTYYNQVKTCLRMGDIFDQMKMIQHWTGAAVNFHVLSRSLIMHMRIGMVGRKTTVVHQTGSNQMPLSL